MNPEVTMDQQLTTARLARKRRTHYANIARGVICLAALALIAVQAHYPRRHFAGLLDIGLALAMAVISLYVDRRDSWQRGQALVGFSIGAGVGLLVLVGQAVFSLFDSSFVPTPNLPLAVAGVAWLLSHGYLLTRFDGEDEKG